MSLNLSGMSTETRNSRTMNLDIMSPLEIVTVMNEEDARVPEAIKPQLLLALGEGTDRIVMTDVGEDGSTTYYRDAEDTHYVPKRTLEQLILNP